MNDRTPERRRIIRDAWINVYGEDFGDLVHLTRESADFSAMPDRVACVKVVIDCREGDGL
jgi:hypothetical protein